MNKRKFIKILGIVTWFIVNLVFFYSYYYFLKLDFSLFTLFFTAVFLVNILLFFSFSKKYFFRFFIFLLYIGTYFYALVNFAYFTFFKTFWGTSGAQVANLNKSVVKLVLDFYFLIPWYIYLGSLFLFVFTYVVFLKKRKISSKIKKSETTLINFLNIPEKIVNSFSILNIFRVLCLLLIVNVATAYTALHYRDLKGKQNLSTNSFFSDLGIHGYFLYKMAQSKWEMPYNLEIVDTVNAEEAKPKTDMEILKEKLAILVESDNQITNAADKFEGDYRLESLPHIIFFQMESIDNWAVKQNPTPMPFLSKLMEDNISSEHFFANSCMTINAEFASLCSFYPESNGPISDLFSGNNYYCLPNVLKDRFGYSTSLFHANSNEFWNRKNLGPKWGFQNMHFTPYFKERESDKSVLSNVVKKIKESNLPTFNYVVGYTSHAPHNESFVKFHEKNNNLKIKPYDNPLNSEIAETVELKEKEIRYYMGFLKTVDEAIENMFLELEKNNLLDNTIVVLYGDHRLYGFNEKLGKEKAIYNYNEIPFAIYTPKKIKLKKQVASFIDITPTILNLIDKEPGQSSLPFLGQNLFSDNFNNFAISKCLGEVLYISSEKIVQGDNNLDIYSSIKGFENKETEFDAFSKNLQDVVNLSDQILKKNTLLGSFDLFLANDHSSNLEIASSSIDKITDPDRDGLSSLREKKLKTDPLKADTDGDGINDGLEVRNGTDPLQSTTSTINSSSNFSSSTQETDKTKLAP